MVYKLKVCKTSFKLFSFHEIDLKTGRSLRAHADFKASVSVLLACHLYSFLNFLIYGNFDHLLTVIYFYLVIEQLNTFHLAF